MLLSEFLENKESVGENECYLFCDWFCDRKSLERRFNQLLPKIKHIAKTGLVNPNNSDIYLKNPLPLRGDVFDEIIIKNLSCDSFLRVVPKSGHRSVKGMCIVEFYEDNEMMKSLHFNKWMDFKKMNVEEILNMENEVS